MARKGKFSSYVVHQLLLLTIYVLIGNTVCLSLDSLHESRNPEDENFKMALDSIHHRRNMAEKRRYHFDSRFTKKDPQLEQNDDEYDNKNYRPLNSIYSPALSRNIQRFLSEIDDDDNIKKKRDRNDKKYEIREEEELKPDVTTYDGRRKKSHKRQFITDMEGPSRIFAHKSSPITNNMEESTEYPINNESKHLEGKHSTIGSRRRKKGKSDLFNYARGMEHYSHFWDPERGREKFQRKRNFRSNNRDDIWRFTKRGRFEKRKMHSDKSEVSSHTNVKRSKDNKEQILGELKEIFKDENEDKKDIKKREDKESGNDISETKLDNSSDTQGQGKIIENREDSVSSVIEKNVKSGKEAGDKFNQWLRDEYFKTMAMTMASTKKKRSGWAPIVASDFDDFSTPGVPSNEDVDDEKFQKFQAIDDKLKTIESAILSDALQLIREGAEERIGSEEYGQKILDKLYAADDVQKLREALDHLQGSMNKIKHYEEEEEEEDEDDSLERNNIYESDNTIKNWPSVLPRKREEDLAKALRVMAPYQAKRQYSLSNGIDSYLPRISMRSLPSFTPDENNSGQLVSVFSPENIYNGEVDEDEIMDAAEECPALDLLSSDCSILGDIVPGGPLKRLVLEACNWHEVCYTCGVSFGLSADDCDIGFVEESKTICQDDIPCQTKAKMMMLPLRQRRIFFKRSVPAVCHRDPCVERFLKHG